MKKILLLTLVVFALSHCEVKMQRTNAQLNTLVTDANGWTQVYMSRKTIDSMEYVILTTRSPQGGCEVINMTKEKLEIEKLKLEIKKLQK